MVKSRKEDAFYKFMRTEVKIKIIYVLCDAQVLSPLCDSKGQAWQ